jgi:signal peptidase I
VTLLAGDPNPRQGLTGDPNPRQGLTGDPNPRQGLTGDPNPRQVLTDSASSATGSSSKLPTAGSTLSATATNKRGGSWKTVSEYAILITSALLLASLIRAFLGLAFWIPSESMDPTLKIGDRVVVSRLSYRLHQPNRGDIVVFQNPGWVAKPAPIFPLRLLKDLGEFVGVGQPKDKNYIKRVIGLPGDSIEGKNGHVYVNGKQLSEPYLVKEVFTSDFAAVTVPAGKYWMMGDNRGDSCDSRCFTDPQGNRAPFVPESKIVGRAFVRVWPIGRMGKP